MTYKSLIIILLFFKIQTQAEESIFLLGISNIAIKIEHRDASKKFTYLLNDNNNSLFITRLKGTPDYSRFNPTPPLKYKKVNDIIAQRFKKILKTYTKKTHFCARSLHENSYLAIYSDMEKAYYIGSNKSNVLCHNPNDPSIIEIINEFNQLIDS